MTVTIGRRAARAQQRSFPVIGLLSSRPPFSRIEPVANRLARDRRQALEQALADRCSGVGVRTGFSSRGGKHVARTDIRVFPPAAPSHEHAGR